jgi:Immunoglobulin-like domain of bacterial spore germination
VSRPLVERSAARWTLASLLALALVACRTEEVVGALSPSPTAPSGSASAASPTASPTGQDEPAIVVRTPTSGDEVVSPVTIAGTADVFEATVSIRILGEDGAELAAGFATATCGSGCRGEFATELSFFTNVKQNGTIEVFESSAEDGSRLNVVSIPVVLVPGA